MAQSSPLYAILAALTQADLAVANTKVSLRELRDAAVSVNSAGATDDDFFNAVDNTAENLLVKANPSVADTIAAGDDNDANEQLAKSLYPPELTPLLEGLVAGKLIPKASPPRARGTAPAAAVPAQDKPVPTTRQPVARKTLEPAAPAAEKPTGRMPRARAAAPAGDAPPPKPRGSPTKVVTATVNKAEGSDLEFEKNFWYSAGPGDAVKAQLEDDDSINSFEKKKLVAAARKADMFKHYKLTNDAAKSLKTNRKQIERISETIEKFVGCQGRYGPDASFTMLPEDLNAIGVPSSFVVNSAMINYLRRVRSRRLEVYGYWYDAKHAQEAKAKTSAVSGGLNRRLLLTQEALDWVNEEPFQVDEEVSVTTEDGRVITSDNLKDFIVAYTNVGGFEDTYLAKGETNSNVIQSLIRLAKTDLERTPEDNKAFKDANTKAAAKHGWSEAAERMLQKPSSIIIVSSEKDKAGKTKFTIGAQKPGTPNAKTLAAVLAEATGANASPKKVTVLTPKHFWGQNVTTIATYLGRGEKFLTYNDAGKLVPTSTLDAKFFSPENSDKAFFDGYALELQAIKAFSEGININKALAEDARKRAVNY